MAECTLTWETRYQILCPGCLLELTNANIVFYRDVAFCPLCCHPDLLDVRDECVRLLRSVVASDYRATYRRLDFFAPSRRPRIPLQLVRTGGTDDWVFDPDYNNIPTLRDDNPVAGGSPV